MLVPTIPNMEVDEISATITILELQNNLPFMKGISRIMVLEFYDELWEIASSRNTGVVITGTPDTSKSIMGWYFIYKLRKQLGLFDLVYQHERSGTQTFYSKNGIVTWATIASGKFLGKLHNKDTVYVVDGIGVLSMDARTFVFTSPNSKSYNEYMKDGNALFYSKV